jgi:hypothetical protein
MKKTAFWDKASCIIIEVDRAIALMMEDARTSETPVYLNENTRRYMFFLHSCSLTKMFMLTANQ